LGIEKESATKATPCSQCGKPAIWQAGGHPLCVDCLHKFQVARTLDFRIAAIGMNYAAEELDYMAPFGGPSPRIQVPEIPKGPMILNNIKVDNSVVGAINTGSVASIDVHISQLKNAGGEEVSGALARLTEAIANDRELQDAERRRLLDQVEFVSEQAVNGADVRRPGMIAAALDALDTTAKATTSLVVIWASVQPVLKHFFGI